MNFYQFIIIDNIAFYSTESLSAHDVCPRLNGIPGIYTW